MGKLGFAFGSLCLGGWATACGGDPARAEQDAPTDTATSAPEPSPVELTPAGGTFRESLSVELRTRLAGASMRYTTDGTRPGPRSLTYEGTPLVLTETTQLRVQAFVDGSVQGEGATGTYVERDFDASGELPLMVLDSFGSGPLDIESRDFETAACLLFDAPAGVASLNAEPALSTRCGFHVRGQSSATFAKTPYRLELWDESDRDRDLPVLSMPAESDWALLGPYVDKTFIRHPIAFDLGRDMGLQAPQYAFVELYLHLDGGALSAADYMGVYLLTETIKNSKNRTDLKQLRALDVAPDQLSGGYIFKFEFSAAEEPTLQCTGSRTTCWSDLEVYSPNPIEPEQKRWLQGHIQAFHDVLHGDNIADPRSGYPAYIDVDSFVDFFILSEFTKNADAFVRSAYFHKDRDQLIVAGPLWDYNLIFGAGFDLFGIDNLSPEGWMYPQRTAGTSDWFPILIREPTFLGRVRTRWAELRAGLLSDSQVNARIDALSAPLAAAAERNFARWGGPGGTTTTGSSRFGGFPGGGDISELFSSPNAPTYAGQLLAMKYWAAARGAWLDDALSGQ